MPETVTEYLEPSRFRFHGGHLSDRDVAKVLAGARDAFRHGHAQTSYSRPAAPLIYLSGVYSRRFAPHLARADMGLMMQPGTLSFRNKGAKSLVFDNGAFGAFLRKEPFDLKRWWKALNQVDPSKVLFATIPDVVGDAQATWLLGKDLIPKVRKLGFSVGYVAQNGLTAKTCPWDDIDAIFVGGDNKWKLGPEAAEIIDHTRTSRHWAHMGRVNTLERLKAAERMGCNSVDGQFIRYGRNNISVLLTWMDSLAARGADPLVDANPADIRGDLVVHDRDPFDRGSQPVGETPGRLPGRGRSQQTGPSLLD